MAFEAITSLSRKYPVTRGMAVYAMLWPVANATEQILSGKESLDVKQMARFTLFGTFFTAPTLHVWFKISSKIIPGKRSLIIGIKKAMIEQVTYGPFALSTFLTGLPLLEGKSVEMAVAEWKHKFVPTWKTAICYWPVIQTINFTFVPQRNRVVVASIFSFIWICFLSYVKRQEIKMKKPAESKG